MKRLLILTFFSLLALGIKAQMGATEFGLDYLWATQQRVNGIGLKMRHYLLPQVRGEVGVTFVARAEIEKPNDETIHFDLHYLFPLHKRVAVYPIAGANLTWRYWFVEDDFGEATSDYSESKLGAKIGLGVEVRLSKRWKATIEYKHLFISGLDQRLYGLGCIYQF